MEWRRLCGKALHFCLTEPPFTLFNVRGVDMSTFGSNLLIETLTNVN